MSLNPKQLRDLITETLDIVLPEMNSPEAVELLMMTAAQESFCGRFIKQLICGVAKGIFQMEPATYDCLFTNYIRYDQDLLLKITSMFPVDITTLEIQLCGNLPYQIVLARLNYRRKPGRIPAVDDTLGLAYYYKKYWNTYLGAATIKEVLRNYHKYAI